MAEKRLIDANMLMKAIRSFRWLGVPNTLTLMFSYLKSIIRDQPTVDAVEVVRCRDCKHRYNGVHCTHPKLLSWSWGAIRNCKDDDFCSYGERKEGAENG